MTDHRSSAGDDGDLAPEEMDELISAIEKDPAAFTCSDCHRPYSEHVPDIENRWYICPTIN